MGCYNKYYNKLIPIILMFHYLLPELLDPEELLPDERLLLPDDPERLLPEDEDLLMEDPPDEEDLNEDLELPMLLLLRDEEERLIIDLLVLPEDDLLNIDPLLDERLFITPPDLRFVTVLLLLLELL